VSGLRDGALFLTSEPPRWNVLTAGKTAVDFENHNSNENLVRPQEDLKNTYQENFRIGADGVDLF
jgi:hypothetical protein